MKPDNFVAASTNYTQRLTWVAIYNTGEVIIQRDDDGYKSSEILDHTKLYIFHLITNDNKPLFTIRLKPGDKFFYRSRTAMRAGVGVIDRIHIVGWRNDNSKNVSFVSESDMHVENGDFIYQNDPYKQLKPWLYEIKWRDIDEVPIADTVVEIGDTEQVYRYIEK